MKSLIFSTRTPKYVADNIRAITYSVGSFIVVIWTILRHFTDAINFDIIGQQLVAEQWANGYSELAVLGPTNYLLKIPVYMVLNGLEFIDPRQRLILVTILFNVITYVLIVFILERIYRLYHGQIAENFYLLCIWLATIFGAIFWLNYPNSRNLEIAGGLALVYVVLRYDKYRKSVLLLYVSLLGGLVFFMDPLQAYMIGAPLSLALIVTGIASKKKQNIKPALFISGAIAGAFVVSKLLFMVSSKLLPVDFLILNSPDRNYGISLIAVSVKNTVVNTLKIFDAEFFISPYDANTVREFLNFLVLVVITIAIVRFFIRAGNKRSVNTVSVVILLTIIFSYLVYVMSGQASADNTARYLIMIPLLTLVLLAVEGEGAFIPEAFRVRTRGLLIITIAISTLLLSGGVLVNYPNRYSKEESISSVIDYLEDGEHSLALSTREVSMPVTYITDWSRIALPIICNSAEVKESYLFFDKASFRLIEEVEDVVPVIVAGSGPNQCTEAQIIEAFGRPVQSENINGVGKALFYNSQSIELQQGKVE